MAELNPTTIYGFLITNADLYVNGSDGVCFFDTNTRIWEDDSGNLTFKDTVAGTYTLWQLTYGFPLAHGTKVIKSYTEVGSPHDLDIGDHQSVFTNLGANFGIKFNLPPSPGEGIELIFAVQVAQEIRIYPEAGKTIRDLSGQTASKYKSNSNIGACITLISDENGDWATIARNGAWTEEA
ncbi:MAG: hypothetical protein ACTSSP_01120 [Candidatus Asgardarchaeia archaeon]